MIALLSLVSLTCGLALAGQAPRFPGWTARMEMAGGLSLVTGLATVGAGIGAYCG
ncbi:MULTISPECIES: hypothetical protein [Methylorubrum]|uniref:hypothetical protein n=1 Tax=Methylorubrum TaxID=2282523 RepID=UPI00209DC0BF|nr:MULTISPECIES: hypothetical protein [Methylorubrum]MCP1551243.1 hypothetical protein [Methylorubrum zatmanii]MCP1552141.1 hypothetical protein [Methylorubrum extorquens]MCP1581548.1 hypothetical protein [Methylorubrum extorquens]